MGQATYLVLRIGRTAPPTVGRVTRPRTYPTKTTAEGPLRVLFTSSPVKHNSRRKTRAIMSAVCDLSLTAVMLDFEWGA